MSVKKSFSDIFFLLLIFSVITVLLIYPDKISGGISDGIMICGNVLIPSLFPFTVLSLLLTESTVLYKTAKNPFFLSISVIFLSIIGGYPVGAKIIAELNAKGIISESFAEKLLCVSINAGPAFIITAVGEKILGNSSIGIILFVAHFIASLEMFLFLKPYKDQSINYTDIQKSSFSSSFVNAVAKASVSMFGVCSYVILFSGIISLINNISNSAKLITSFLEITNAVLNNKNIYTVSFFLGFSSICIIMQVLSFGKNYINSPIKIFSSRIFHGLLSIINLKVLLIIFPQYTDVLSNKISFTYKAVTQTTAYSLLLIALSVLFVYSLQKKKYCGKINIDIW